MKSMKLFLLLGMAVIAGSISAQKISVKSGSLSGLKGVDMIKTVYDYSDLGVGDFKNENDYIAKKMAESEKDKPGSGEEWKKKWYSDRASHYEPKFEELIVKYLENLKAGKDIESDVVMKVHTTFIEPGYNIGISRRPAYINLSVTITKAGTEMAVVEILKSPGADFVGADFDSAARIGEAYAKAAKSLSSLIEKQTK
jgi:hypothetical protein